MKLEELLRRRGRRSRGRNVGKLHFIDFDLIFVEEKGLIHSLFNLQFFGENDQLLEQKHLSFDKVYGGRRGERRIGGGRVSEERGGHFGDEQRVDDQKLALGSDLAVRVVETLYRNEWNRYRGACGQSFKDCAMHMCCPNRLPNFLSKHISHRTLSLITPRAKVRAIKLGTFGCT